jgi:hypothetical protein
MKLPPLQLRATKSAIEKCVERYAARVDQRVNKAGTVRDIIKNVDKLGGVSQTSFQKLKTKKGQP